MRSRLLVIIAALLMILVCSGLPFSDRIEGRTSIGVSQDPENVPDRSHPAPKGAKALFIAAAVRDDLVLLVGERGLIFRSTDAGKNFQQIEAPTRRMLCSVVLGEDGLAYAVGHDKTVLRSRDSGLNWELVHRDPEADLALFSVIALDGAKVIAVGSFGTVLISEDEGQQWRLEVISEDGPHLYSIQPTGSGLVIVGEFGSIFESHDAAASWTAADSPYEGTFFHVIPLDVSGDLLLLGLRGNLWEGNSGDWKRVDAGSEASLFGGSTLAGGEVVVVGDEGRVLIRSADGQWQDRSPGERRLLSSAVALPDGSILVVGEKGYRIQLLPGEKLEADGEGR